VPGPASAVLATTRVLPCGVGVDGTGVCVAAGSVGVAGTGVGVDAGCVGVTCTGVGVTAGSVGATGTDVDVAGASVGNTDVGVGIVKVAVGDDSAPQPFKVRERMITRTNKRVTLLIGHLHLAG
jgi:hypothetical protein